MDTDDLLPVPVGVPVDFSTDLEVPQRWVPGSRDEAEWAALKLTSARDELAALEFEVDDYVNKVLAWAERRRSTGRIAELKRRINFFTGSLMEFVLDLRAANPKVKSIELPSVTLATAVRGGSRAKSEVYDEDAVIEWAERKGIDCITKRVAKTALDCMIRRASDDSPNMVDGDGEVVPGVRWVEATVGELTAEVRL